MNAEVQTSPLEPRAREVLEAYGRALDREAHVLAKHPELTLQQLHNRLRVVVQAAEALAMRAWLGPSLSVAGGGA